jgi:hypothetical protein
MLRRARISFLLALLAGLPAFLTVTHEWKTASAVAAGVCFAFSTIFFLFGMFEAPPPDATPVRQAANVSQSK